mgnify:CR=1 FL=1
MKRFCVLNGEIAKKGLRKSEIAKTIGVSYGTFRNKMNGATPFTWDEVNTIKREYFPECSLDYLFSETEQGA